MGGHSSIRGSIRGWFWVERVLAAKRANPPRDTVPRSVRENQRDLRQADTSELEREIDQLVALRQLYGLTPEEIAIVEGK